MLKIRRLIAMADGRVEPRVWLDALRQEPPVSGAPRACSGCPLRRGGEWEEGAREAMVAMTADQRGELSRQWGCHEVDRPCAGMTRLEREDAA